MRNSMWRAGRRLLIGLVLVYAGLLLGLSLLQAGWPQRAGLLALSEVLAPYLFAPLLVLWPLALPRGRPLLRLALVACAVVFGVRFLPLHFAQAQAPDGKAPTLRVMQWNVREGGQPDQVRAVLGRRPADIVALDEADWRWMLGDPVLTAAYPYQTALRDAPIDSIVLLSTYPIQDQGALPLPTGMQDWPRGLWARLRVAAGSEVTVVAVHPPPAQLCRGPCSRRNFYFSAERDARISTIHDEVAARIARGERVLLLGDFNLTDREPAYLDVAQGLYDAQRVAGQGLGSTWRPARFMGLDLALLRIDYLFSSPGLVPVSTSVDCTPRGSDHCIVQGRFAIQ